MDSKIILKQSVNKDQYTNFLESTYDYICPDEINTIINNNIILPDKWNIGMISGFSGSGKTTLLKTFGSLPEIQWDHNAIISNFKDINPEQASVLLSSVGLNSIPTWCKSFNNLSFGEQFRANLARCISIDSPIILVDEFTSVIDRDTAKSTCNALHNYIKKNNKKIVVSTCHTDIKEWLRPDWYYDTNEQSMIDRGLLRRPEIKLQIFRCKYEAWHLFKHHHYLSNELHKSAKCFLIYWDNKPIGFVGILAFPNGAFRNGWRLSRIVILPEYQGLGLGIKICNYFASIIKSYNNGLFYIRTRHPAMVKYLSNSNDWQSVGSKKYTKISGKNHSVHGISWKLDTRNANSFKYIGAIGNIEESRIFYEKPTE